jgi:benzoyl-CoA reductase/2-hydroxyglutaryl-CoA dehydratase subunit BcrC/BadD/HgdB
MSTTAIAELTAAFEEPFRQLGNAADRDADAVVISWPSVPVELIRVVGLRAVVARGSAEPTPAADAVLEPDLFPSRLRRLVEAALTGRLNHVAAIVLPRTSDPDYKCFLYLRELVRRSVVTRLPPVFLFDLLQSTSADVRRHDVARTRDLVDRLAGLAQRRPTPDELRDAIAAANAARAAARRLDILRRSEPRLTGVEALRLLGAFWHVAPERYSALASAAADSLAARSRLMGPRVLLAGAPVDSTDLQAAVEAQGAIVVAEISPFGSGVAGADVDSAAEPLAALADRYRESALDARLPVAALERWIEGLLPGIDIVVVSLPPDDATFGWDYPRLRRLLEQRSVPHVALHGDPTSPLLSSDRERIEAVLAPRRREVRLG